MTPPRLKPWSFKNVKNRLSRKKKQDLDGRIKDL